MEILLSELISGKDLPDILLRGISADSREIKKGELFVSLTGQKHEGNDFISDAISNGAVAVITDKPVGKNDKKDLPIFCLPNLRQDLGKYASRFFRVPLQKNANNRADWDKWKNFCDSFSRSSFEKERFELRDYWIIGLWRARKTDSR